MLFLQLCLYCLLFFLLVKAAVRNDGRNCLYFSKKAREYFFTFSDFLIQ